MDLWYGTTKGPEPLMVNLSEVRSIHLEQLPPCSEGEGFPTHRVTVRFAGLDWQSHEGFNCHSEEEAKKIMDEIIGVLEKGHVG